MGKIVVGCWIARTTTHVKEVKDLFLDESVKFHYKLTKKPKCSFDKIEFEIEIDNKQVLCVYDWTGLLSLESSKVGYKKLMNAAYDIWVWYFAHNLWTTAYYQITNKILTPSICVVSSKKITIPKNIRLLKIGNEKDARDYLFALCAENYFGGTRPNARKIIKQTREISKKINVNNFRSFEKRIANSEVRISQIIHRFMQGRVCFEDKKKIVPGKLKKLYLEVSENIDYTLTLWNLVREYMDKLKEKIKIEINEKMEKTSKAQQIAIDALNIIMAGATAIGLGEAITRKFVFLEKHLIILDILLWGMFAFWFYSLRRMLAHKGFLKQKSI